MNRCYILGRRRQSDHASSACTTRDPTVTGKLPWQKPSQPKSWYGIHVPSMPGPASTFVGAPRCWYVRVMVRYPCAYVYTDASLSMYTSYVKTTCIASYGLRVRGTFLAMGTQPHQARGRPAGRARTARPLVVIKVENVRTYVRITVEMNAR